MTGVDTPAGRFLLDGFKRIRCAKRLGIEFPVLLDKDRQTFDRWGATILPTAFLIDRDGKIRYLARGELEWDRIDIVEIVQTLANRMPNPGRRPLQTDR